MERFALVQFTRRTGKITNSFEAYGSGMIGLWALEHTTKTRDTIIFSIDTGKVKSYYEGTEDFPKVLRPGDEGFCEDIEAYCPGILKVYREGSTLKEDTHEDN